MKRILFAVVIVIFASGIFIYFQKTTSQARETKTVSATAVSKEIAAAGTLEAVNQAQLRFQLGGKLVYLPFKEGDRVSRGQVVAQLGTYDLRKKLEVVINTYTSLKDSLSQIQEDQRTNVLTVKLRAMLEANTKLYGSINEDETTVLMNAAQRLIEQSQVAVNSAQAQIDLANSALQLATLTSPINGVITHEDVTLPGVNITPSTTFTVSDLSQKVFRAGIPETYISFIKEGGDAKIKLNSDPQNIVTGQVSKIYPEKIKLTNGDNVYRIDIASDGFLNNRYPLSVSGQALIDTNTNGPVYLVPAWTVINGHQIWVLQANVPVLLPITVSGSVLDQSVVTFGLNENNQVITDPEFIVKKHYPML